jgi:hypothetical protein
LNSASQGGALMWVRHWHECSLRPYANMRFRMSCNNFVKLDPTAAASMPIHWKIVSSSGAFFFLQIGLNDLAKLQT